MYRRTERRACPGIVLHLCMLAMLTCVALPARGDDVASWLESHGFTRLLAEHYEEQLPSLRGDDRVEGATRLARLYAQLLMDAQDRDERTWLETRGSQLLKGIPAGEADDLRVELLNGRYRVAEDIAERHRLRLDELGEVERAIESLGAIIDELELIQRRTSKSAQSVSRSVERGTTFKATSRRQRLVRLQQLLRRTEYLLAWSYAYRGWLANDSTDAEEASAIFTQVLDLEPSHAGPEDVSLDRRSEDSVAWSVLGMAFCRGMTRSANTAMQWFDLLEVPQVPESVSQILPAWRLAVLLDAMELERVQLLLDELEADGDVVPTTWWRLVAVHALERASDPRSRDLADRAVAALAARNALEHLYDLVERYGDRLAGDDGFALAYARGVLQYKEAQEMGGEDGQPMSQDARRAYRAAGLLLEHALEQQDRTRWSEALAGCSTLLGWCRWHDEQFEAARDSFLEAAGEGTDLDDEEAFWMAIVCQDRLARDTGDQEAKATLTQLMESYLQRWPSGTRAGTLAVRHAEDVEPSFEAVDALEQVPPDDPAWPGAQRRAAQMLYALFSDGKGDERTEAGTRYLVVALPLLSSDADIAATDAAAAGRCMARTRRVLEVALNEQLLRLVAAEAALAAVQHRTSFPMQVPEGFEEELKYRHLQIALARNDRETAERLGLELVDADEAGLWTRLGSRAILRNAIDRWNEAGSDHGGDREDIRRVSEWGRRILSEKPTLAEAISSPGMVAVGSNVARADLVRWQASADAELGQDAWTLYGVLLELHPKNQQFLRGRALLSIVPGDSDEAMRCWRVLLTGTTPGSIPWFEARTHHAELLGVHDPDRAREVLKQHHVLYPDWGPSPWGERLRSLDRQLRIEGSSP